MGFYDMPLTKLTGTLGVKRAAHLLRRSTFGPSRAQIDEFALLNVDQAIPKLFNQNISDPQLPIDPATGTEWVLSGTTDANSGGNELQELIRKWWLGQMLIRNESDSDLDLSYSNREKIVFFMHTYLTTKVSTVNNSRSLYFQNQLFRLFAFDNNSTTVTDEVNFVELTKKICVDNAMLKFLDGQLNLKNNPNENFARELLELYTIGRGLEGALPTATEPGDYILFTEQDVQAAAKVLSGFNSDREFASIDPDTGLPRGIARGDGTANQHDNGTKQFSDRLGNRTISPDPTLQLNGAATEESALEEISQLIEFLYEQRETSKHLCRKLYRFYVYHEITEELDATVIEDMTDTFISSGYKLQSVLEDLFSSQHFYDAEDAVDDDNFGSLIKSPLDLTVSTLRFFKVVPPDYETNLTEFYDFCENVLGIMNDLGMDFYEPFEVAGYAAYHQFPIYNRNWISTNYLTRRYDFIQNLIAVPGTGGMDMLSVDVLEYTRNEFGDTAENARILITDFCKYLLPYWEELSFEDSPTAEITSERINYFLRAFLFTPMIDDMPEDAWNFRWNNPVDDEVVLNQLNLLLNAIMQSPEFQLM
ncbi:MAG: DUF1800 family protein [Bacteroidota bacterium]